MSGRTDSSVLPDTGAWLIGPGADCCGVSQDLIANGFKSNLAFQLIFPSDLTFYFSLPTCPGDPISQARNNPGLPHPNTRHQAVRDQSVNDIR